eukprot:2263238-Rhodomonas_salina.3
MTGAGAQVMYLEPFQVERIGRYAPTVARTVSLSLALLRCSTACVLCSLLHHMRAAWHAEWRWRWS